MITPTKDKALARWDILPQNLREALFAESVSDFLQNICENEHIPQEKIKVVSQVAGYVLLGFLHPEDVSGELKEKLNLDTKTASVIQDSLNQRIFAPLRADIDKVYEPVSMLESASFGPIILNDINTSSSTSTPQTQQQAKPLSISTATSQTLTVSPSLKGAAQSNANIPPVAPKTNRLSDIGWSRSRAADPVVKLDISPVPSAAAVPTSAPKQQTQPAAAQQQSAGAPNHSLGEFDRLNAMKKGSAPTATAMPAEPAPFILHQDSSFKAQEQNTAFTLPKPGTNAQIQMSPTRPPTPVRPAVLEFGKSNNPAPTKPAVTPAPTSKAIHYTEFNAAPLSSMPTANSGPRQVSEISPAVPMPTPPRAPMPPASQSSQPQTQQKPQPEKVIVKDFL